MNEACCFSSRSTIASFSFVFFAGLSFLAGFKVTTDLDSFLVLIVISLLFEDVAAFDFAFLLLLLLLGDGIANFDASVEFPFIFVIGDGEMREFEFELVATTSTASVSFLSVGFVLFFRLVGSMMAGKAVSGAGLNAGIRLILAWLVNLE
jgi:hypothetical protein